MTFFLAHRLTAKTKSWVFQTSDDLRVERDKVDLLFKGFTLAILSTLTGPALVAWLFSEFISIRWAWGFALLVYILHGERYFFIRRFHKARTLNNFLPAVWANGVAARLGVMGVVLTFWNLATIASGNETAIFYAITLAAVMSAGALTQFCIYAPALWAFVTPFLLGITTQLLWIGSKNTLVSAVYMGVLWLVLVVASRRFSIIMHRDLEHRYRQEALLLQLSKQKTLVEQASEAKSRFLAAASHDLRQPVHAVALLASALQDRSTDPNQQALLASLQGGVAHFADVVNEILDVARLDADAVVLNMEPVLVQDLLDRLEVTYSELARAKGLGLMIRPAGIDGSAAIQADPALLWRVLSNLVSNAVRYTDKGSILIAVRPEGRERGNGLPAYWRIEVRDSGKGIEQGKQNLIFEEFYQLENLERNSQQGLGLGLAVAKRMAQLMQMPIRVRSALGRGSTFSVAAKSIDPSLIKRPQLAFGDGINGKRSFEHLRVLIVDDNADAGSSMVHLMQSWGITAIWVTNGKDAIQAIAQGFAANVLMTDHWLADGENAFSVADLVSQTLSKHQQQSLVIAVITGDIRPAVLQSVQEKGWHFAAKPLRPLALRMWLESLPTTQC